MTRKLPPTYSGGFYGVQEGILIIVSQGVETAGSRLWARLALQSR
jgi:hypothetical protein